PRFSLQPESVHPQDIAAYDFAAQWHRPVNPCGYLHRITTREVSPEFGRDLDGQTDLARAQAPFHIGVIPQRCAFFKITRASEVDHIIAADFRLVVIQHGEGQVFDVQRYAVGHDEHQNHAAKSGERQAEWITSQLQYLDPEVTIEAAEFGNFPLF